MEDIMMHDKTSGYVIAILNNGKVLREVNGKVYLPFYSDYSIRIKNPKDTRVGVSIDIDGTDVTDGKIIVDARSHFDFNRMIVDGNLYDGPSLRFVPIGDGRVQDPTSRDNGIVLVKFYPERTTYYRKANFGPLRPDYYYNTYSTTSNLFSCSTSDLTNTSLNKGATVPGSNISQAFITVSFNCDPVPVAELKLQLLGSNKSLLVEKTRRSFCVNCGTSVKNRDRFCYKCGARLRQD